MKKILILFILIVLPLALNAQLSGSGTWASPYSGTFEGNLQWNSTNFTDGKVFVGGDVTIDNEELIIGAGMKIIFVAEGADLIINGTGQLTANGTSGNKITFTADDDDDGTYGETGERWGHIAFDNPSGSNQSKLEYCIIEYGSVSGSGYAGAGGGILIRHSNVTVSNSIIRNNSSDWGGGIFIDNDKNPYIYKCLFKDNTTIHGGGGIYCWNGVSSVIENCIFDSNHCTEPTYSYYSGGAVTAQKSAPIQVLNCTFVNNTSTQPGDALLLASSSEAKIVNCIFWGSSDQIAEATSSQVDYCAIEGSSGYTHTITLTHSGATGPNFTAIDGSDWSIKFISPCRDFGVNSYTGVTIPTSDYIGNPTIGTKDIGAYEVQYSRWLTNAPSPTSWSSGSNWEQGFYPGYTGTTGDVVIPSLASSYAPNITGTTTISSGKYMVLNPGAKATFATLSNSGTLKLESDASNIASLIVSTYTDNGNEEIELYLTGGGSPDYKWHYISSPVSTLAASTFAPTPTQNLAQYVSNRPSTDPLQGWVAYDGYVYFGGGSDLGNAFSNLSVGKGYNYYHTADYKYTFSGQLNTGIVNMPLAYTTGDDALYGFNLLGNPFSSGLDWDQIIIDGSYPANTSKGVYFTRDNVQCSYIGGVGDPMGVTGVIPPMQGFFTKTYGSGNSINLLASARVQDYIHDRYKGATIIPLVRLSISEDSKSDETVVRFDEQAKTYLDNDFDALKMFISAANTSIYSSLGGIKYSINGQPFPETFVEIPIVVNLLTSGNHSISTIQLQGLDSYKVFLIDNTTGFTANLKTTPVVTFSSSAGLITDRFILKVTNATTGIEDPVVSKNIFNIYQANDLINIQTIADEWEGKTGTVRVLDLTGKTICYNQNSEFWKNSLIQIPAPGTKGLYIIEIKSGVKRYVGKVIIR